MHLPFTFTGAEGSVHPVTSVNGEIGDVILTFGDISDSTEGAQDAVGAALVNSARVTLTYVDGVPSFTADLVADSITAGYLHATAQYVLFGRSSAAAGPGEEIVSSAAVFTLLGSANNAAILANIGADAKYVELAGDTMTGQLNVPRMVIGDGTDATATNPVILDVQRAVGNTQIRVLSSGGNALLVSHQNLASTSGASVLFRRGRGSVAVPAALNSADQIGVLATEGHDGTSYVSGPGFQFWTAEAWSAGVHGNFFLMSLTAIGASAATEAIRMHPTNGLSLFGSSNVVIDANRHFRTRTYTIATLPTATGAGEVIQCSDLGGGAGTLESTAASSAWRRRTPGYQTLGDTTETITPLTHAEKLDVTSTLTANRTKTLSNTRAYVGASFLVRRRGLGNFTLAVANHDAAVLYTFPALSTGDALFVYDGTNWVLETIGHAAGKYTPTLTGVTNVGASTAYECQFSRVGNVVTVSGKVDVDPTAAGATELGISLPFASNFGAIEDCGGAAFATGVAGQGAAVNADAANDRARMQWVAVDVTNQAMFFSFTYEII